MIRNASVLIAATCMAFFIAGCFEYEEELVLNKDGSGTLKVHYSKMNDVDVSNDEFNLPDDKDDIRDEIEKKWTSKKVKLVDFNIRDRDKSKEVDFTLKFKDVMDLNEVEQFAESEIEFKPGRHCRYQRVITTESDWDIKNGSTFEQVLGSIIEETILEKIKFRFEVKMPCNIVHSNTDWIRDERNAVWRFTATDLVQGELEMVANCK